MFILFTIILIIFHDVQSMKNGLHAVPGDFPFAVAIRNFNSYCCSGILINELNVLTAAHAVDILTYYMELTVVIGNIIVADTVNAGYDALRVKTVYLHPEFAQYIPDEGNEKYYLNDIAVLQLHRRVTVNIFMAPASLMTAEAPWGPETDCSIISWNRIADGFMRLMWDKVKYVSDEDSQGTKFLQNQKGFNDLWEMEDITSDDIGSPIVCNNQVIGLVVKGRELDQPKKPATLLFIYNYLEFMWEIMNEGLFDIGSWQFPYVATIWNGLVPECGGFIVDDSHVATTGSCMRKIQLNSGRVTVGYTDIDIGNPTTNWLSIKDYVRHPNYTVKHNTWPIQQSPNDIAIITLTEPLKWTPTVAPLVMEPSDNSLAGQICQVLRWVPFPKNNRKSMRQLTLKRSVVVILNEKELECLLGTQGEETSFWGRTPYVMPIVEQIDGGNPIICGQFPVGMVLQDKPKVWNGPKLARFHKILPFIKFISTVTHRTQSP